MEDKGAALQLLVIATLTGDMHGAPPSFCVYSYTYVREWGIRPISCIFCDIRRPWWCLDPSFGGGTGSVLASVHIHVHILFWCCIAVLPILADPDKNKNNSPLTNDMPHRMPL